jgi:DNA repair exonuclease SbcCD ATPase subunit
MEEYFEGLHLIDFEQLKIENNTLTEKIEDRNEEILKLKKKINDNVQILAHIQEKYTDVNEKYKKKQDKFNDVLGDLTKNKVAHGKFKRRINKNSDDHLMEQKKLDMINSKDLKKYYIEGNKDITNVYSDINNIMVRRWLILD